MTEEQDTKIGQLQIEYQSKEGTPSFCMQVSSIEEAVLILSVLKKYDTTRYSEYLTGYIERLYIFDGEYWQPWQDEATGITDPVKYLEYEQRLCLEAAEPEVAPSENSWIPYNKNAELFNRKNAWAVLVDLLYEDGRIRYAQNAHLVNQSKLTEKTKAAVLFYRQHRMVAVPAPSIDYSKGIYIDGKCYTKEEALHHL